MGDSALQLERINVYYNESRVSGAIRHPPPRPRLPPQTPAISSGPRPPLGPRHPPWTPPLDPAIPPSIPLWDLGTALWDPCHPAPTPRGPPARGWFALEKSSRM